MLENQNTTRSYKTTNHKGEVFITGERHIRQVDKENLLKELDELVGNYTDNRYAVHIVLLSN